MNGNESDDPEVSLESEYEELMQQYEQNPDGFSYEDKVGLLDTILQRLDNSETPIDELAKDVKLGTRLIKELKAKLAEVETDVRDAFKGLGDTDSE